MMWSNLPRKERSRPDDPDEIELAYLLQNQALLDPSIIKRIISRYITRLYRWVTILLHHRLKTDPSQEQILPVLEAVFTHALQHADQFHGNQSISDWLFAVSIHVSNHWKIKNSKNLKNDENEWGEIDDSATIKPLSYAMAQLDEFSEQQYRVFILRYLFHTKLDDIAQICNLSQKEVHEWLKLARNNLVGSPLRAHLNRELQAYCDGLLDHDPAELDKLNDHLAGCSECQRAYADLDRLEKLLSKELNTRWKSTELSSEEIDQLYQSIINVINQPKYQRKPLISPRQAAWLAGMAVLLVGVTLISIRLIPIDAKLTQEARATTSPVAHLSNPSANIQRVVVHNNQAPLYVAPSFSSDGNWGVFTASTYDPSSRGLIDRTVYLYNRAAGSMQPINGSKAADNAWVWWDLTPSISSDGQWIVFVTSTNDPNISGIPCETSNNHACLDIMLYNRTSGTTRRLTQSINGGPADGDSLAPTISGDGKWIAFWSTADNLVDGSVNSCQNSENSFACLNIYIYSLADGKIQRIPVQMTPGDSVYGVDRISLSADGRYIAFTVTSTMQIGSFDGLSALAKSMYGYPYGQQAFNKRLPLIINSSEAIVYDREKGTYELCNQSEDGIYGNGESSSPVLSGDGKYVVFVSKSTNLIPGDTMLASEVYVRDRTNGKIEMVSVSSDGSQSNRDNGLTFMERGYYSVNISADGRYVVFESAANNLSSATNPDCNNFDNITCVFLYVHDRQTGITKTISALPDQDFTLLPGVSSDGRWISYMEYFHSCSETQMRCSNVMLYDQQSGWTSNLTNYGSAAPRLPWTYTGGIALPWQTWESGAIAVSGDNKLIALGGSDASVRIWNTARIDIQNVLGTANYMFNIGGTMSFSSVAFSGDGKWLAGGTTGGDIYIWNIENRQLSYQLAGHYDLIRSLVFTPDGSDLIIATSKEVWVWNFRTDQFSNIDPENLDISGVYCVAIAPRGDLAAVAYLDGTIWLQSLPSGKFIDRLGPDLFSVSSLVFSQDGSMLAASQRDGTIHIWQINWTNETVASIIPYNKFQSYVSVGQLVFSPDHEYLASTGTVGEVPIWNISSGILFNVTMAIPNEMVFGLQFTADGKKLAVEFESRIDVWDIPSQQPLQYFSYAYKDNFIDSSPFSAGTVNDLPRWHDRMRNLQGVYLDLSQAASAVDYPLIVPGILPQDFTFLSAMVNYDGSVWLRYVANISEGHQEYIYIYEQNIGSSDPPPVMVVGQGAEVALTQIATQSGYVPAESVQGDWLVRRSFTSPSDGSNTGISHYVWYWNSASISQHLRWQQDGILIGLYYQPYTPYGSYNSNFQSFSYLSNYSSTLSESDLEQIASGMVSFHDVSSPALSTAILRDDSGY